MPSGFFYVCQYLEYGFGYKQGLRGVREVSFLGTGLDNEECFSFGFIHKISHPESRQLATIFLVHSSLSNSGHIRIKKITLNDPSLVSRDSKATYNL